MKKALVILGLAMCTTFAFAQTDNNSCGNLQGNVQSASMQMDMTPRVSYKASIFTKADVALATFKFSKEDTVGAVTNRPSTAGWDTTGFVYGRGGRVIFGDSLDGQRVSMDDGHTQIHSYSVWNWINNAIDFQNDATFQANFPRISAGGWKTWLATYMDTAYTGNKNDGFMLVAMTEQSDLTSGAFNSYVQIPTITNTAVGTGLIDVEFQQIYEKYYDNCYIDYKVNGKWKSREINVTGVDVEVNNAIIGKSRYTMPFELKDQPTIDIRFRYFHSSNQRGNAFGYFWAIDHVTVYVGETDKWQTYDETYLTGGYGIIPQGMNVPLTWYTNIANNGISTQKNVKANIVHLNSSLEADTVIKSDAPVTSIANGTLHYSDSIVSGNPTYLNTILFNEQGLWIDSLRYSSQQGWFGFTPVYGNDVPDTYGKRGLPTENTGINYVYASVESTNQSKVFDTIAYTVSGQTDRGGRLRNVSIWAHDNGVIPSQSAFRWGYTDPDDAQNQYLTSEGHYNKAGYRVTSRYTTGDVIPQGLRILGVEYIVATTFGSTDELEGSSIIPYLAMDEYEGSTVHFNSVNTGMEETAYEVEDEDIEILPTLVKTPGQSYKAIDIFFPEQPELLPNTSYRVGYSLNEDAEFAVASTSYRYAASAVTDSTFNYTYYNRDEETKPYYRQFEPGSIYDILVWDNSKAGWFGNQGNNWPMIRLLVGQEVESERDTIFLEEPCSENHQMVFLNTRLCDTDYVHVAEGTSPRIYFYALGDNQIDSIFIDGVHVKVWDGRTGDRKLTRFEQNVLNADSTLRFRRYYYCYTFENISARHTVRMHTYNNTCDFGDCEGINTVASNVQMSLYPNPATNSVKVSLNGVTGMVNCSILDMSGRVVRNVTINAESDQTISLKNIPAGAYFVRITNDEFSKVEKLIVR